MMCEKKSGEPMVKKKEDNEIYEQEMQRRIPREYECLISV
jgi:hypothetical protein